MSGEAKKSSKELADEWKNAEAKVKRKFQDEAKKNMATYKDLYNKYVESGAKAKWYSILFGEVHFCES